MKASQRGFALFIGGVLALSLAACSAPATGGGGTASSAPVAGAAEMAKLGIGDPSSKLCQGHKTITVGFDVFSDTQDYVVSFKGGLDAAAKKMGGCVKFVKLVDNLDAATAVANVKTFIERKVDAVLLFQVVASAQPGIMQLLNAAKIPVIAHAVPAPGATFISPKDTVAGEASATQLIAASKQRYPGKTPYVILGAEPTVGDSSTGRVLHQADLIKKAFPDLTDDKIIILDTDGTPDNAFAKANAIVAKVPADTPVLVSGINDDVVSSIFRALEQAGKSKDVVAVGINATYPSAIQNMCKYPQFVGSVDFGQSHIGNYIVPALLAVADGSKLPAAINPPVTVVTKADVPKLYPDFAC